MFNKICLYEMLVVINFICLKVSYKSNDDGFIYNKDRFKQFYYFNVLLQYK